MKFPNTFHILGGGLDFLPGVVDECQQLVGEAAGPALR